MSNNPPDTQQGQTEPEWFDNVRDDDGMIIEVCRMTDAMKIINDFAQKLEAANARVDELEKESEYHYKCYQETGVLWNSAEECLEVAVEALAKYSSSSFCMNEVNKGQAARKAMEEILLLKGTPDGKEEKEKDS